ncbi:MAG TPA: hypothetical protein PLI09_14700 [Candidatus Hydrogenedentes bacterium]|nr:hypothetical protein [Candidatus Hydrogenedentota bacterium]
MSPANKNTSEKKSALSDTPMESPERSSRLPLWLLTGIVIAYVAAVLALDTLAVMGVNKPIHWSMFSWHPASVYNFATDHGVPSALVSWMKLILLRQFDVFKFVMWFLVPFLFSLWWMDWGALGFRRWKKVDLYLLLGLAALGMAAMILIPLVPSLSATYGGLAHLSSGKKWGTLILQIVWIISWLPGWEFMHRYVLLRKVSVQWPQFGWILVPVFEGVYHLQKPLLEALGMAAISIILTQWTLRRRNVMLPFIVHLIIEIELLVFLLFR